MSEFQFTTPDGATLRGLDEGEGPALLCVSGLGGTAGFWDPCTAELRRNRRVLRLDQRGIGASTRGSARCSVEQLAEDCLALLDARDITSCAVLGHSTGGCIAQAMAIAAPRRVRALALGGTWARPDRYLGELFAMRLSQLLSDPLGYARTSAFLSYEPEWLTAHWETYERTLASAPVSAADRLIVQERIGALLAFDQSTRLGEIGCPALVLGAQDDVIVPPHLQRELAAGLPQAQLKLLARGGHFFPVTRRVEYLEILEPWLARVMG